MARGGKLLTYKFESVECLIALRALPLCRGSRGRREEEPASASQAPPERLDSSALGQPERAGSGKPGLLRRFKDALRRPGSGGSRMDRQESTMMDRQESVLLPNGSGGALPEPSAVQDNLAGIREESSHVPSSSRSGSRWQDGVVLYAKALQAVRTSVHMLTVTHDTVINDCPDGLPKSDPY